MVLTPRNAKQVSNTLMIQRNRFRLTHDALYNLHELAYDLNGYVHKIITYPDVVVVCGLQSLITEFEQILQASRNGQLLLVDTTFQLGDFYATPFLFRNTMFATNPVMPALVMLHERKYKSTYMEFMKIVSELVPSLRNTHNAIPLVCDDEKGICDAAYQAFNVSYV